MRINLNHLSMIYPNGRQALKDISLTLESPSLIGLVGPNGAGKSPGFFPQAAPSALMMSPYPDVKKS